MRTAHHAMYYAVQELAIIPGMVNSGSQGELARHRAGQQNMTPGPPPNPQAKRQAYQKDCDFANAGVDRRHNPQVQGANVSAAPAPKLGLAGQGQAQAWAPATLQTPLRPQQFPSSQPFVMQVTPWSCASPQPSMAQVQQQGQLTIEPSPRAQQGPAPACNPHQHGPSAMPLHQQYCDSSYAQASPDASRLAMPPDIGGGSVPTRQPWAGSPVACSAGLAAAMMGTQGPEPWAHSMRLQLEQTPYMQLPFPMRQVQACYNVCLLQEKLHFCSAIVMLAHVSTAPTDAIMVYRCNHGLLVSNVNVYEVSIVLC